jgi:hypothetical protein
LGGRGRWISEFEASLVYRVSSRTAQRNPVLKNHKKKERKEKKRKEKKRKEKKRKEKKRKEKKRKEKKGRLGKVLMNSSCIQEQATYGKNMFFHRGTLRIV